MQTKQTNKPKGKNIAKKEESNVTINEKKIT